jgi:putative peptide zinc metalloprotease protein
MESLQMLEQQIIVDTSEGQPVYLLAVGKNPTYIRLSPTSYYLLKQRSLGTSFTTLATELSQSEKQISPDEVESAYHRVIDKIAEIERNPKLNRSGFLWRRTLIPQKVVQAIAHHLSIAFAKPIAYSLLGLIGFSIAIAPQQDALFSTNSLDWFLGYLLFLISLIFHEFGHASACAKYGAKPSDIGFTLYLIWPAFYSDVSAAWQLKRWQRVVVDVGGVFFQLVAAAIYIIIYKFTGWMPLKIGLLLITASCFLTLNPVFKFDGYWLVADALGVTNLSQQPIKIFQYYLDKLRRLPVKPLPWSPFIISILAIYMLLSFGVWGYFFWIIIPIFSSAIAQYPALLKELAIQISTQPPAIDAKLLQSFLGSTFMMTIMGFMLWKSWQLIKSKST